MTFSLPLGCSPSLKRQDTSDFDNSLTRLEIKWRTMFLDRLLMEDTRQRDRLLFKEHCGRHEVSNAKSVPLRHYVEKLT